MAAELYSLAAEQAVIGGLILESAAWSRIIAGVAATDFYRPDHRTIFAAIEGFAGLGKSFDLVTLADYLERRGQLADVGGLAYLGTLARDTPGVANIASYASTVRDWSLRRQLKAFAAHADRAASASTADADATLLHTLERLLRLRDAARIGTGLVGAQTLVHELVDDLDNRRDQAQGLNIGLADFDQLTHGLEPGDLVLIAGRPGMGKTAAMVTIAAQVATRNHVAVFSAEMPSRQLMRRSVARVSGISQSKLRTAKELTDEEWAAVFPATSQIAQLKLSIDDTSAPTLAHIRSECAALKARTGVDLVIVDYLQLMRGTGTNRYDELRQIAYGLKALAKDLAVPVIALAQLNREVETRDSKRPRASDLRDSGALEEAADIIGLLYSEGYYDRDFAMHYVLELNVVKHRNGERGQCLWSIDGAHSRVAILDDEARTQYRRLLAQQNASARRAANDL